MRKLLFVGLWVFLLAGKVVAAEPAKPLQVDHRYSPPWWQTSICLPDDGQKTLVGKNGELLYDWGQGKYSGFKTRIGFSVEGTTWVRQELVSPRLPIVRTLKQGGSIQIVEEAFAIPAPRIPDASRRDLLLVHLTNTGQSPSTITPMLTIESSLGFTLQQEKRSIAVGKNTVVSCGLSFQAAEAAAEKQVLKLDPVTLAAGGTQTLAFRVARGDRPGYSPNDLEQAQARRDEAEKYWQSVHLPYGHLEVPDAGVQAMLDSSIRNIYQAREIKEGLPAFQVGPTCYRGLWVVDGSFLMEAVTFIGRGDEARNGIRYLLKRQGKDGGFMLIDGHWKETGIVLWAVSRHAKLMGDKAWLAEVWPNVERGFAYIQHMRQIAADDPKAPNYRLIPAGFSDGGLAKKTAEYTNIYWSLAGMKAAVDAARWLGKTDEAAEWQKEYDDFYTTFRKAADRDMKTDAFGNRCLPIYMIDGLSVPPQKVQWAFLHAVFPGKIFAADDPLVKGNMAMLRAVESEGLVLDTGWAANGIWNYFGSFYAHAWLWLGDRDKAIQTLYAFANHASPLLVWREEQQPQGQGNQTVGDMPHNWASAEFIRLVRHCLVLERGQDLHLFEALPAEWTRAGMTTRVREVATEFGPISLELRVSGDGKTAQLQLDPPKRNPPGRIVLHLDGWSGQTGTMELPLDGKIEREIRLR